MTLTHQSSHKTPSPDNVKKSAMPAAPESDLDSLLQQANANPNSLTPGNVLQLQRAIGNQAVMRLLQRKPDTASLPAVSGIQRDAAPAEEEMPANGASQANSQAGGSSESGGAANEQEQGELSA